MYVGRGFTPAANVRTKNGGSKPPPYDVFVKGEFIYGKV